MNEHTRINFLVWNAVVDALLEADSHAFFHRPGWTQVTADRLTKEAMEKWPPRFAATQLSRTEAFMSADSAANDQPAPQREPNND